MTSAFETLLAAAERRKLPPVRQWRPARTGDIDIRIASDGRWFHEGREIRRARLVKLFATVLRRDADGFCLVTPAEKLRIIVEDAPFIAVDMESDGAGAARQLVFATNVGDSVLAGVAHPIEVRNPATAPRPYLEVRDGLKARIARSVFYRLVDLCDEAHGQLTVWSAGTRFAIGPTLPP